MAADGQPSRVTRSKEEAKVTYDRLSRWYDLIAGWAERKAVVSGLDLLAAAPGETILEIGYGTGQSLAALAHAVGPTGHVYGIDISEGMRRVASRRLRKAGLSDRVTLLCGDATILAAELQRNRIRTPSIHASRQSSQAAFSKQPVGSSEGYRSPDAFDGVFLSFVLDLIDTPEIPIVLSECQRVLRSGGRIAVVAMQNQSPPMLSQCLYEWAHRTFPRLVDCRPIDAGQFLAVAGFDVTQTRELTIWRLPVSIVLAVEPEL